MCFLSLFNLKKINVVDDLKISLNFHFDSLKINVLTRSKNIDKLYGADTEIIAYFPFTSFKKEARFKVQGTLRPTSSAAASFEP